MKIYYFFITFIILISNCIKDSNPIDTSQNQDKDFGYENWPGKNCVIKCSIELPMQSFLSYELELRPGFNDSTVRFKIPLSEDDTVKIGRLDLNVYGTVEKAQYSLVEFLYTLQSPFKPPQLTQEEFPYGDVAFGEESDRILFVCFTRANVSIILKAPTNIASELAAIISDTVLSAPAWNPGDPKPAFIITEKFNNFYEITIILDGFVSLENETLKFHAAINLEKIFLFFNFF